ncbi:MAG: alkaline phosphatase PafA [Chitinophagales bacterium]
MKLKHFCSILLLICSSAFAKNPVADKPKLVIGIVVDQMRWDFLYRYSAKYGNDGFKRLQREGYSCENTHIPYSLTFTAPGHTCIYTGSVPALHGITGNNWYDRIVKKEVYCTSDKTVQPIGGSFKGGQQSPHNLKVTTITDELRLATNFKSKVIALAIKDRSSILPGGHTSSGTFWYDDSTGNFITSSFYRKDLPQWVTAFNNRHLPEQYLKNDWKLTLDYAKYEESSDDDVSWENNYDDEKKPVFTHAISGFKPNQFKLMRNTPFGNSLTFEFAKAAIEGDTLGNRGVTDFLAVSFSPTDGVGHQFGPNSVEVEDMYLRFDKEMASFIQYLDTKVGKGNYLLFLSADHGAAHAADFSKFHKIPSESMFEENITKKLDTFLLSKYNSKALTKAFINHQIFFNEEEMQKIGVKKADLKAEITQFLLQFANVNRVVDLENLGTANLPDALRERMSNMYLPARSGDLEVVPQSAQLDEFLKGTTHGTPYAYDTHIPLIWYGWKVKKGKDYSAVNMTDISRTLAALLNIQQPSGCVGKVIEGLFK